MSVDTKTQQIAASMLFGDGKSTSYIPEELSSELREINYLCSKAGGQLVSRQAIAVVIIGYMRRNKRDAEFFNVEIIEDIMDGKH